MTTTRKIAQLPIRLKGFTEPDTRSQFEGYLDPGHYIVKEIRKNFPDEETDYALVLAPALGAGDTWICTRWKHQQYVQINEVIASPEPRQSFENDPLAVDEQVLVNLLPGFESFTYTPDEAHYPFPLPGVNLPQSPPEQNNCCTFVEALLVKAWAESHADFTWDSHKHGQMMIFSNDDYFSPVTAVVESAMAIGVADADTPPHPWTLIQGWRKQWRGGHTFIIVDYHQPSDRVLTLESNSAYGLNGVGFRQIGNLRDVGGRPPQNWWDDAGLWTWEKIQATYQYRQQACLKVRNRQWSGS
jgi:hypothetical protein